MVPHSPTLYTRLRVPAHFISFGWGRESETCAGDLLIDVARDAVHEYRHIPTDLPPEEDHPIVRDSADGRHLTLDDPIGSGVVNLSEERHVADLEQMSTQCKVDRF